MATKQDVLDFLKHDRTAIVGRNLYNQFPQKNLATQSYLANLPGTDKNLRVIAYELCKLVGIPERQMNALLNHPITEKPREDTKVKQLVNTEPTTEEMQERLLAFTTDATEEEKQALANFLNIEVVIPEFSEGVKGNQERQELAKTINLTVEGKTNKAYDDAFANHANKVITETIEEAKKQLIETRLQELDIKTKESIKLRDQFPFLKEADCPRILHLLVADLITAHEDFITKQPLLHQNATQEQLQQLVADVTASYIEKKEVFAELEYYKENNALLGKHSLFAKLEAENVIIKLDSLELAKKIENLTKNINKNKNKQKSAENDTDKAKYQGLVDEQTALRDFAKNELANRK